MYHEQFLASYEKNKKSDTKLFEKSALYYKLSSRAMTELLADNFLTFDMLTILVALLLNLIVSKIHNNFFLIELVLNFSDFIFRHSLYFS